MDIQIVILLVYLSGIVTAIWYLQFTDCIRRFQESQLNPVPQAMLAKYLDSKKHDIPSTVELEYDSEAEDTLANMQATLQDYLGRYPKILVRYMQADSEEARESILDELRHCASCAADNVECTHNEGEVTEGVLPQDLAPVPLTAELN